jgi:hypothetical protein
MKHLDMLPHHIRKLLKNHLLKEQLRGHCIMEIGAFKNMDSECRATFLSLLRPIFLLKEQVCIDGGWGGGVVDGGWRDCVLC